MNTINEKNHKELIEILTELIETIKLMKNVEKDYLLIQNEDEARDWLDFLKNHTDKEELKSLENEISECKKISVRDLEAALVKESHIKLMEEIMSKYNEIIGG